MAISKEELYKLYVVEKNSMMSIAKRYGVCVETIRKHLKKYNIPIRKPPVITKEELYKLYITEKKSLRTIAKIYNVSKNTIRNRLISYNIPLRKNTSDKYQPIPEDNNILELYANYKTIKDICKIYNTSYRQVRNYLIKHNVKIRDPYESIALKNIINSMKGKL